MSRMTLITNKTCVWLLKKKKKKTCVCKFIIIPTERKNQKTKKKNQAVSQIYY